MSLDPQTPVIRQWFERIYLGGIPQMINDELAFLSFICVLTAVEALAGYRYGSSGGAGDRFRDFVTSYFAPEYRDHASDLWDFRNGMVHGFSPRRFALTHHNSRFHLSQTSAGATILNAEDFYGALVDATRRYFGELERRADLQVLFAERLGSRGGGGIGVGPVEVVVDAAKESG